MKDWKSLQDKISEWAISEGGPKTTTEGLYKHLCEEVRHLDGNFYDAMAYADVLILLMALAKRHKYSMEELQQAVEAKHNINVARIWEEPDQDGIARHRK